MLNSHSINLLLTAIEIPFTPNLDNSISFMSLLLFAGAAKETPIVTPLMEFVRQKRAVESGTQVRLLYSLNTCNYVLIF